MELSMIFWLALVGPKIRTALKLLRPCRTNDFQACAASYPPPGIGLCDFVRSVFRVWWPTRVNQLSAKHRTSSSARSAWAADFDDHCFGGVHSGLVGQHRDSGRALRHPHYPVPAVREAQVWGEDGHQEVRDRSTTCGILILESFSIQWADRPVLGSRAKNGETFFWNIPGCEIRMTFGMRWLCKDKSMNSIRSPRQNDENSSSLGLEVSNMSHSHPFTSIH